MSFTLTMFNISLQGVTALDYSVRMGLGSLQFMSIHSQKYVNVPEWFVRAYAPLGELDAHIDPVWLLPGEIRMGDHFHELADNLSEERIVQLMIAFLQHKSEAEIQKLRKVIEVAVADLKATREQFESAAVFAIRQDLEQALRPEPDEY